MVRAKRGTCTAPNCDQPNCSQGLCFKHYRRWQRHGSLELPEKPAGCSVEGCQRKHRCKELCGYHYSRLRQAGTLEPPREREPDCAMPGCDRPVIGWDRCEYHYRKWRADTRPELCTVDGCIAPARSRTWCQRHYSRWKEHGSELWEPQRRAKAQTTIYREAETYVAAHLRIRKLFGPAARQRCIDCGRQAAEWSYDHADPAELVDEDKGFPFSTNPEHYDPRCKNCHRQIDGRYKSALGIPRGKGQPANILTANLTRETMSID